MIKMQQENTVYIADFGIRTHQESNGQYTICYVNDAAIPFQLVRLENGLVEEVVKRHPNPQMLYGYWKHNLRSSND